MLSGGSLELLSCPSDRCSSQVSPSELPSQCLIFFAVSVPLGIMRRVFLRLLVFAVPRLHG